MKLARTGHDPLTLALAVLTGVALVGIAVVHLRIAGNYVDFGKHPLALSDQFRAQAVVAFLLTVALLVRPHVLVWLATFGFAAVSLGVLVYSRYKSLPVPGLDGGFQETWAASGAKAARAWEIAALVLSALGAATSLRSSRRRTAVLSQA
jgi:hypothetical protein